MTAASTPPLEAQQRSRALLESFLDKDQLARFKANGTFDVIVRDRRYLITGGNVHRFTKHGVNDARYCIVTGGHVPHCDNMLAQKFLLEADEKRFLRIANNV